MSDVYNGTNYQGEIHHQHHSRTHNPSSTVINVHSGALDQSQSYGMSLLNKYKSKAPDDSQHWWVMTSRIATCCFVPAFLDRMNIKGSNVQQAWREKITLCFIILSIMSFVAFFTAGLRGAICLTDDISAPYFDRKDPNLILYRSDVIINGFTYDFNSTKAKISQANPQIVLNDDWFGQNLSPLFDSGVCADFGSGNANFCSVSNKFPNSPGLETSPCLSTKIWKELPPTSRLSLDYEVIAKHNDLPMLLVIYNNAVLDLTSFLAGTDKTKFTNVGDLSWIIPGKDLTLIANTNYQYLALAKCLASRYTIGFVGLQSPGCTIYGILMYLAISVVMGVIIVRFVMAFVFHWFVAPRLSSVRNIHSNPAAFRRPPVFSNPNSQTKGPSHSQEWARSLSLPTDLFTICMVTCYSENEIGIRNTLDSLAATDFPDERKLLLVICDGLIKGEGNEFPTPDIVLSMIEPEPLAPNCDPMAYLAIADGEKQTNMARVHPGKYLYRDRYVPIVVVVKCGTPKERDASSSEELAKKKAGNRGKRDSQLIMMNFLNRLTFNERMTPLDFDLFWKIQLITGVTPDQYELVLMVDADTIVSPDSLRHMVQTMVNDEKIMGLCGETRIANKSESWVTMIQVYEYFTSHNLGKSFESIFGGVTCLPGCFCMYRIKNVKPTTCVPILVKPEIVNAYSENVVDTLHKKNLLLLGEDRFLSTLMLKTFPRRKMVYVPQAICHTTVPHTYKMLQSQRRRWINSTIHNLLELVFLPTLCGTFCFSMQFVVALDLFGTVSLPAAILLVFYLLFASLASGLDNSLPLTLLLITLMLPGVLVLMTTKKPVYFLWMFVYLAALPVWNFALPLYAFWHFDDFSWGDSKARKVEGEEKGVDHSKRQGSYLIGSVPMMKWEDWEKLRRYEMQQNDEQKETNPMSSPPNAPVAVGGPPLPARTAPLRAVQNTRVTRHQKSVSPQAQSKKKLLSVVEARKIARENDLSEASYNPLESILRKDVDQNSAAGKKVLPADSIGLLSQHDSTIFHDAFSKVWGVDPANPEVIRSSTDRPPTAFRLVRKGENTKKSLDLNLKGKDIDPSTYERPISKFRSYSIEESHAARNIHPKLTKSNTAESLPAEKSVSIEKTSESTKKISERTKRNQNIAKRYSMPVSKPRDKPEEIPLSTINDNSIGLLSYSYDAKVNSNVVEPKLNYDPISNTKIETDKQGNTINKFWKSLYLQQSQTTFFDSNSTTMSVTTTDPKTSEVSEPAVAKLDPQQILISPIIEPVAKRLYQKGKFMVSSSDNSTPEPISFNMIPRPIKEDTKPQSLDLPKSNIPFHRSSLDSANQKSILLETEQLHNLSFLSTSSSSTSSPVQIEFEMGVEQTLSSISSTSVKGPREAPWTRSTVMKKEFGEMMQGDDSFNLSAFENGSVGKKFQQVWRELSVYKEGVSSSVLGPRESKF